MKNSILSKINAVTETMVRDMAAQIFAEGRVSHSAKPTDDQFVVAPGNVMFDTSAAPTARPRATSWQSTTVLALQRQANGAISDIKAGQNPALSR